MSELMIVCPHCKKEFPFTAAIGREIQEKLREEFEEKERAKEEEFARKESAMQAREERIKNEKKAMDEQIKQQVEQKMEAAKKQLEQQAEQKAREDVDVSLRDLSDQLDEKTKKLDLAKKVELELRKRQREMEERDRERELENERKLVAERQSMEAKARTRADEEYKLKLLDKDKTIKDMRDQMDEMNRKLEQGSQQSQGEVLELELERALHEAFPEDQIEAVPKGKKGADLLQRVYARGRLCGTIIWESKRTKNWGGDWIAKLKEDQRDVQAEIAALVSVALPKDITYLGQIEGVWVTNYPCLVSLAMLLRTKLIEVAATKASQSGQQEKMDLLYEYLSGPQFRQRVEAVQEYFGEMQKDLLNEKNAMERFWTKRQKHMELVVKSITGMDGDMRGIMGSSLPQLKTLEVRQLEAGREEAEEE